MNKMKIIDEILKSCRTDENYELDDVIEKLEKFKLAQQQINDLRLIHVTKRFWHFDSWDKKGNTKTIEIEALNEENATIIFIAKHRDLGFDTPY